MGYQGENRIRMSPWGKKEVIKLDQKGLVSGFYASIIALIFGSLVGGLGIWSVFAATSRTVVGGWLILLVIGIGLGYLYSFVKYDKFFQKEHIVKGAVYGVIIWIITLILAAIFPILGQAAFAQPLRSVLFVQLLTHLLWGATLGFLFEQK